MQFSVVGGCRIRDLCSKEVPDKAQTSALRRENLDLKHSNCNALYTHSGDHKIYILKNAPVESYKKCKLINVYIKTRG